MSIFTACENIQAIYRKLLNAMTHPGKSHSIDSDHNDRDEHWLLLQVASCLMDHEVTFALSDPFKESMGRLIVEKTGSQSAGWAQADFILIDGGASHGRAEEAKRGSLAFPDKGATLLYCIPNIITNPGTHPNRIRLSGPGIEHPITPQVEGLDIDEYRLLRDINSAYPLGIDAFVIKANDTIMGLPRSTRIEVE